MRSNWNVQRQVAILEFPGFAETLVEFGIGGVKVGQLRHKRNNMNMVKVKPPSTQSIFTFESAVSQHQLESRVGSPPMRFYYLISHRHRDDPYQKPPCPPPYYPAVSAHHQKVGIPPSPALFYWRCEKHSKSLR